MNKSDSIKELSAALAKAQGEMEGAPKDTKNQFGGFYADLGSVIQAAKKPLSSNGLSLTQHPEITDGHVTVTSLLCHASGEWLESSISAPIGDNRALSAAQQAGIVITYLRRYAYAAIVGIYADEDTDGAQPPQKSTQTNIPANGKPAPVPTLRPLTPLKQIDTVEGKPIMGVVYAPQAEDAPEGMLFAQLQHVTYQPTKEQPLAKLGGQKGHNFPASWTKIIMMNLDELDRPEAHLSNIIWAENIPQDTAPERVLEIVKAHLDAKPA